MNEDKMTVLKMIENGTITAEEGMQLLKALDQNTTKDDVEWVNPQGERVDPQGDHQRAKWIDFKIEGSKNVEFSLPVKLIEFGIDMSQHFKNVRVSGDIDVEALKAFVLEGQLGEVMVVKTEENEVIRISLRA